MTPKQKEFFRKLAALCDEYDVLLKGVGSERIRSMFWNKAKSDTEIHSEHYFYPDAPSIFECFELTQIIVRQEEK